MSGNKSDLDVGPTSTEDALISALWAVASVLSDDLGKVCELTTLARIKGWSPQTFAAKVAEGGKVWLG